MKNAKDELLMALKKRSLVKCAHIWLEDDEAKKLSEHILKIRYSGEELSRFLDSLDFMYNHGYGFQSLYGNVWFEDGTWLSRGEYDGSEWWQYNACPDVPEECQ